MAENKSATNITGTAYQTNYGWICPKCGTSVSPYEKVCPMCGVGGMLNPPNIVYCDLHNKAIS